MSFRVAIRMPGTRQPYIVKRADLKLNPLTWSASAIGGPMTAEIDMLGSESAISQAFRWLAHRIEIYNRSGQLCWHGVIDEIDASRAGLRQSIAMNAMWNRIRIAYTENVNGTGNIRGTTAWASDDLSRSIYGTKEIQVSRSDMNQATAESNRDAWLSRVSMPTTKSSIGILNRDTAKIRAVGLWKTLDWQYYDDPLTTTLDTDAQITNMLTAADYIQAVNFDALSGIGYSQFRDGDSTIRSNIEPLMEIGVLGGRRYTAHVDIWDTAWIMQQPIAPAFSNMMLDRYGKMELAGGNWPQGVLPAGQYVGVKRSSEDPYFVETASYNARTDTYRPEGVDDDPFDINVIEG